MSYSLNAAYKPSRRWWAAGEERRPAASPEVPLAAEGSLMRSSIPSDALGPASYRRENMTDSNKRENIVENKKKKRNFDESALHEKGFLSYWNKFLLFNFIPLLKMVWFFYSVQGARESKWSRTVWNWQKTLVMCSFKDQGTFLYERLIIVQQS